MSNRSAIVSYVVLESMSGGKLFKAWVDSYHSQVGKVLKLKNSVVEYRVKEVRQRCPRRLVIDNIIEVEKEIK